MQVNFYGYKPKVSFGTMRMEDAVSNKEIDSDFFRDLSTQKFVANELKQRFPQGKDILVYANSSGEDSFSMSLLIDNPRFNVFGFDISSTAHEKYSKGFYALNAIGYDSFLMNKVPKGVNVEQRILKRHFDKYFKYVKTVPGGYEMRKYNGGLDKNVYYMPVQYGDIRNIDRVFPGENAGSIFFRNSFFHFMPEKKNFNNFLNELRKNPRDFDYILRKNTLSEKEYADFKYNLETTIDGVYNKLNFGGFFVMGNIIQEHYFLPPRGYKGATVPFLDTPLGKEVSEVLKNGSINDRKALVMLQYVKVTEASLIAEELEKGGGFAPMFYSNIQDYPSVKIPTVWEKTFNTQSCSAGNML